MEGQRNRVAKTVLKKNHVGEISLSDFKSYYIATITKTVRCLRRDRHTDQCNETDNRFLTNVQWRKNNFFNRWY